MVSLTEVFKCDTARVLDFMILNESEEQTRKAIRLYTKISNRQLSRVLPHLVKEGFLLERRKTTYSSFKYYKFNSENPRAAAIAKFAFAEN